MWNFHCPAKLIIKENKKLSLNEHLPQKGSKKSQSLNELKILGNFEIKKNISASVLLIQLPSFLL